MNRLRDLAADAASMLVVLILAPFVAARYLTDLPPLCRRYCRKHPEWCAKHTDCELFKAGYRHKAHNCIHS